VVAVSLDFIKRDIAVWKEVAEQAKLEPQ
jgi:hypothetical protein